MVIAIFTSACSVFNYQGTIEDFDALIYRILNQNQQNNNDSDYTALQLAGFSQLINASFNYGVAFNGSHTFVSLAGYDLLLRYDGTLFHSPLNLRNTPLSYDKFVFEQNGLLGVKSIFNQIIVAPSYTAINIKGNLIVASDNFNRVDIFYNNTRIHYQLQDAQIYSYNILLYNYQLVDPLTLTPLKVGDYHVMSDIINTKSIISDGFLFGFTKNNTITIPPQFLSVGHFNPFGFATAITQNGDYIIIDKQGNTIVTAQNSLLPINFDGNHITFLDENQHNMLGIADYNFNPITQNRFLSLLQNQVFNNFLVYNPPNEPHRFFSLFTNSFVLSTYAHISYVDDFFIARCFLGLYNLFDLSLRRILGDRHLIGFNNGILTVRHNSLTRYYHKLN